jgi:hypothetical protein
MFFPWGIAAGHEPLGMLLALPALASSSPSAASCWR